MCLASGSEAVEGRGPVEQRVRAPVVARTVMGNRIRTCRFWLVRRCKSLSKSSSVNLRQQLGQLQSRAKMLESTIPNNHLSQSKSNVPKACKEAENVVSNREKQEMPKKKSRVNR